VQALVADDSAAVRELLVEHLTRLGFEVEQAVDGLDALAKLARMRELAVVLLDWTMPGMDGIEVLRRVRADPGVADVPVVLVATDGELPFVEEALSAGASEYLMKPFDAHGLLEKLLLLGIDPECRRAA
jgi:CheY-like chemotaxis protein